MVNHTLTQTVSIVKARNKWFTDNDQVQQFINDNYTQLKGSSVDQESLYQTYRDWCEDNGIKHPLTMTKLKNELDREGITRNSKRPRLSGSERPRVYYYENIKAK